MGIIYLQFEWIRGAMRIKHDQYGRDIYVSLVGIRDSITHRKDNSVGGLTFPSQLLSFSGFISTPSVISNFQLKELIRLELRKKNIHQSFEYCIINEARVPTMFSSGYKLEYLNAQDNYSVYLTSENSIMNSELLNVYILEPESYFNNHLLGLLLIAFFFTSLIISAFVLTLKTMFTQKKLSEIKSDFINNMTHEFKTPIATIQLASDALKNEKVLNDKEQILYYSGIIKEENRRMNKQVEKILQSAQLERDEIKLQMKPIDVHALIQKVAENARLQLEEAEAVLELKLQATQTTILADEVHFSNIIFNLLDNAIKYSGNKPRIEMETRTHGNHIDILVRDHGIGMDKETQHHIFEKFFRAHTGNLHNVKGFGLGLTYVKRMVDLQGGRIEVESELGKGSTFILHFQHPS